MPSGPELPASVLFRKPEVDSMARTGVWILLGWYLQQHHLSMKTNEKPRHCRMSKKRCMCAWASLS